MKYTELQVTSNFSFLRGASHPEELVEQAAALGYEQIAITDRNSFAGIVRAYAAGKRAGIRIIAACRLDLLDGCSLLAYPTDVAAYSLLCNLLTLGNRRAEKGECHLYKADVYAHAKGTKFIVIPPEVLNNVFEIDASFWKVLEEYRNVLGDHLYMAVKRQYQGDDSKYLYQLRRITVEYNVPLVATNDVHYHLPERRQLQDIRNLHTRKVYY